MTDELQKQALDYVAHTQPLLDALVSEKRAYADKAAIVAPVFVRCGLIAEKNREKFTQKLASDVSVALDYLVKLAELHAAPAQELGEPVDNKQASVSDDDAFVRCWQSGGTAK